MRTGRILAILLILLAIGAAPGGGRAQQTPETAGDGGADQLKELPFSFEQHQEQEKQTMPANSIVTGQDNGGYAYPQNGYTNAEFARDQLIFQATIIILLCVVTVISLTLILRFLAGRNASSGQLVNGAGLTLIIFGTFSSPMPSMTRTS